MLSFKTPSTVIVSAIDKLSNISKLLQIKKHNDTTILLSVSNENSGAVIYVNAIITGDGKFVIDSTKVLNLLSSTKTLCEFTETDKYLKINFSNSNHRILKSEETVNFIKIANYKESISDAIGLDINSFCKSIRRASIPSNLLSKKEKMYLWEDAIFISIHPENQTELCIEGFIHHIMYREFFAINNKVKVDCNTTNIVNSATTSIVSKIFKDSEETCKLVFSDNWLGFISDSASYFTLKLNIKYPDFNKLLKKLENYNSITVHDKSSMTESVTRIRSVLDNNTISLEIKDNIMILSSDNSSEEVVVDNPKNLNIRVKLDINYLLLIIKSVDSNKIDIGFSSETVNNKMPIKISADSYFYFISPII